MTSVSHLFSTYSPCAGNRKIKITDSSFLAVIGTGSIHISPLLTLKDMLHVPRLDFNLLSVDKLTQNQNCHTNFFPYHCEIQGLATRKMIGNASLSGRLYYSNDGSLSKESIPTSCLGVISDYGCEDVMIWHFRLRHPSFHYLKHLFLNLFSNKDPSSFQCEICALAIIHKPPYSPRPYVPSKPFFLVHSDIWGPFKVSTISGK